jgi:hypothetical protein
MEKLFPHGDAMLRRHKLTDPARRRTGTGVDTTRIKANFKRACETFADTEFIARAPLIPRASEYGVLGEIRAFKDFEAPSPEGLARFRAMIDKTFGRGGAYPAGARMRLGHGHSFLQPGRAVGADRQRMSTFSLLWNVLPRNFSKISTAARLSASL